MRKPEHVNKMKNKLCEEFGIVKDSQLRKILGVRYEWKRFYLGEIYAVMSMNKSQKKLLSNMKIIQEKTRRIFRHQEHQVPHHKRTPDKDQHEGIQVIGWTKGV